MACREVSFVVELNGEKRGKGYKYLTPKAVMVFFCQGRKYTEPSKLWTDQATNTRKESGPKSQNRESFIGNVTTP